jgi:hypothetical protein
MNMKDERSQTRYEMRRPAAPSPVTPLAPGTCVEREKRARIVRRAPRREPERSSWPLAFGWAATALLLAYEVRETEAEAEAEQRRRPPAYVHARPGARCTENGVCGPPDRVPGRPWSTPLGSSAHAGQPDFAWLRPAAGSRRIPPLGALRAKRGSRARRRHIVSRHG